MKAEVSWSREGPWAHGPRPLGSCHVFVCLLCSCCHVFVCLLCLCLLCLCLLCIFVRYAFLFGPRPLGWGLGPMVQGPWGPWGPYGPGAGAPGPKLQDTHGECNYLLSGRLPTVRQANGRCQRCAQKAHTLHPQVSAYMHPFSLNFNKFRKL